MAGINKTGFSIIVCTYNGATRLPVTLQYLAALNREGFEVELLVVSNACTDNTDSVVWQIWAQLGSPFSLKLLHMPTPGKSHALMLAFVKATMEYFIICDDDNRLAPDYLQVAAEVMAGDPEIGIAGGRAEAVADIPIPGWFYREQYAWACGCPHNVSADFTGRAMLWGAGMVIRSHVAQTIMHPDCPTMLTGRKAGMLTAGEDDEKCVRTWLMGYKTWFEFRLLLYHYMPAVRLTHAYAEKLKEGFNSQGPYISAYRRVYEYYFLPRKPWKVLGHFGHWLAALFTGNITLKRTSSEFLYMHSGLNIFRQPYIEHALSFYRFQKNLYVKKTQLKA